MCSLRKMVILFVSFVGAALVFLFGGAGGVEKQDSRGEARASKAPLATGEGIFSTTLAHRNETIREGAFLTLCRVDSRDGGSIELATSTFSSRRIGSRSKDL